MARELGAWKQRGKLSPSFARQLSDGMDSQPAGGARARPDPGAIYTSLVEGSPSIALEGLKKAIRTRRLAQAGREEREKEARERWGLELVTFTKEAELPCTERMQAMGGQNSQWLRLFGNRRSKTLRNRAMAWKGFRAWLQVARGEVWPSNVGCFLKYLEERHEVQEHCFHHFLYWRAWGRLPVRAGSAMIACFLRACGRGRQSWRRDLG